MIRFFLYFLLAFPAVVHARDVCRSIPQFVSEDIQEAARAAVTIQISYEHTGNVSIGSGFIVNKNGRVATNFHVIEGPYAEEHNKEKPIRYYVVTNIHGCRAFEAKPVFTQRDGPMIPDIAFLDIIDPPDDVPVARFANRLPKKGEEVYAVGAPHGRANTIMKGYVLDVDIHDDPYRRSIYATPYVQEGNSGGMLVNMTGGVVGMVRGCEGRNVGKGRIVCVRNTYAIPTSDILNWLHFIK